MRKVAIIMCNDMHMDKERVDILQSYISQNENYCITNDIYDANIIIILTCAFGDSKKYSVHTIAHVRVSYPYAEVIVTGCLLAINRTELEALSGIMVKTFEEVVDFFKKSELHCFKRDNCRDEVIISYGCLKRCSYCIYPQICGKYKSKSIEDILLEARELSKDKKVIYLTGSQETSDYGIDLFGKPSFPKLLREVINNFPDCNYVIGWFHLAGLTDEMMTVLSEYKNVVGIMLHIQHVSDRILKAMNRPSFKFMDGKIRKLKELRPYLSISTEVIVGFPGETQLEFQSLVKYLENGYFNDIGVASYEQVLDTPASLMDNQIPLKIREERMNFIKNKFNATPYPTNNNFEMSVIEEYIKAISFFEKILKYS